ncbi:MAG: DUF1343 domain-containing protein [bacterium]
MVNKYYFLVIYFLCSQLLLSQTINVKTGIEVLRDDNFSILEGKNVGLVTNATGVDSELKSTIDILFEAKNFKLIALFGPEHGVRGDHEAGEYVEYYTDKYTNLPVYSLFGTTRKATPDMLKNIDVLVYDVQDIGCRSYTFISTLGLLMEAAAENKIEVVVLDRPNPLGGIRVEGNLVEDGYISFVSQFKIPYVYGLTCGELAEMLNNEGLLENNNKCKLTVVKMQGWNRDMIFEETGLPWVLTSPHVPHKDSPFYYCVSGILGELYSMSIGVGYTLPFQTFAAEWIDGVEMAKQMNALNLEGVIFRPITYKPYYSTSKGKYISGVQIHITDFKKVKLTEIQFYFMQEHFKMYPDKNLFEMAKERFDMFDKVCGSNKIRENFTKNFRFSDIKDYFEGSVDSFKQLSAKYYIYK